MILDGYSARVIREWYTHIGGSPTRLQASTRYIDYEHGFDYVVPPSIEKDEAASAGYKKVMTILQMRLPHWMRSAFPVRTQHCCCRWE